MKTWMYFVIAIITGLVRLAVVLMIYAAVKTSFEVIVVSLLMLIYQASSRFDVRSLLVSDSVQRNEQFLGILKYLREIRRVDDSDNNVDSGLASLESIETSLKEDSKEKERLIKAILGPGRITSDFKTINFLIVCYKLFTTVLR